AHRARGSRAPPQSSRALRVAGPPRAPASPPTRRSSDLDAFAYTFSTTTADADPGNGTLRFDNATYASVTKLFIDLQDAGATDVTAGLDTPDVACTAPKGTLRLLAKSDATSWVEFKLTSL